MRKISTMRMQKLHYSSMEGISGLIRQGKLSPVEIVDASLKRIEELNPNWRIKPLNRQGLPKQR